VYNTGKVCTYFTSDNEPDGIENATHNTFPKLTCMLFFQHKTWLAVQFRKLLNEIVKNEELLEKCLLSV
jgi:hypothetical protein